MKKFLSRLKHIFISRTFAKVAAVFVTLIVLFYAEENWRAARAWAAAQAKWEAQGETFDYAKFIPPPIPNDQNLAAIPLYKLDSVQLDSGGDLEPLALRKALQPKIADSQLPSATNNGKNAFLGDLPDMAKIREFVSANYAASFGPPPSSMDTLAQFEAIYPFVAALRAASATRPFCRLSADYTIYPPFQRALGLTVEQINVAKHLRVHACIALDCQRPDLALDDLAIAYKLLHGAERDPSLVGGLVAIGINAIMQGVVFDGLARHAWNDGQLRQIEQILGQVDFLTAFQFAMKSEAAVSVANIDYIQHTPRFQRRDLFMIPDQEAAKYDLTVILWSLGPRNWWNYDKVQATDLALQQLALADPAPHRAFPAQDAAFNRQYQQMMTRWDAYAPWNIFVTVAVTNGFQGNAQKYAYAQTWLDQMRVACALERYRLAHGAYPATLSSLVPDDIETLPCDVITGKPLHYNLHPDGTYLLYSIGWNQKDDGGTLVFDPKNASKIDYMQGDWVWPVLKPATSP